MRIGIISYWTCPLTRIGVNSGGGMSIYILNLVNNLAELGHKVDIFTRSHNEKDENIMDLQKGARIIHLPASSPSNKDAVNFAKPIFGFIAKNKLKYDIIHSHYYLSSLSGIECKKKLNIPLFVTFHTLGAMKQKYLKLEDKFRILAENKIISHADCIIVSTELEKQALIDYYKANKKLIEVVYPGVNHRIFKKIPKITARNKINYSSDKCLILFVGRIDPVKGIETLIESISILLRKNSLLEFKLQVILIGGKEDKKYSSTNKEFNNITDLIKRKRLSDVIKLIGSRPNRSLPYYYNGTDITVLPSVYESFGLVVLEAMACGACVVASNTGGPQYLIRNGVNGKLFENGSAGSLANTLKILLNNVELRKKIGQNALSFSNSFCWSKQAEKMVTIYEKYL